MERITKESPISRTENTITFISNGNCKAVIVQSNKLENDNNYNQPLN